VVYEVARASCKNCGWQEDDPNASRYRQMLQFKIDRQLTPRIYTLLRDNAPA
jgi:hypothetical protein